MSLWNPHVCTPTGLMLPQTAPPALRIIEGEATADQLAAAQQAFYKFCMHSRLSAVPNPTEIGRLPDGSRYRITDIAGVRTMELWLEDDTRSGIVIAFSALDGSLLEGHVTNGESTTYLLTPRVKKGTRKATGKWRVRKLSDPKGGGKAVNTDATGKIYFTGYQGRPEENYPSFAGRYASVNEYAYAIEDTQPNSVFRHGSNVGVTQLAASGIPVSPIPFVLQDDTGKKHAAQLVLRQWALAGGAPVIDLLVGPISTTPSQPIGDVVASVALPTGFLVEWWGFSFSRNGNQARAIANKGGRAYRLTLEISKESLSYVLGASISLWSEITEVYEEPVSESYFSGAGGSYTSWSRNNGNAKSTRYINGVPVEVNEPAFGVNGTGYRTSSSKMLVHAFNFDGDEVDDVLDIVGSRVDAVHDAFVEGSKISFENPAPEAVNAITTTTGKMDYYFRMREPNIDSEIEAIIGTDIDVTTTREDISKYKLTTVVTGYADDINGIRTTYAASGGGFASEFRREAAGSVAGVYFNRHLGIYIYVAMAPEGVKDNFVYSPSPDQSSFRRVHTTTDFVPGYSVLVVKTKTKELVRETASAERYVAYSASDPMTGAIVINLQGLDRVGLSDSFKVVKSWLFAVDNTGVKDMNEIFSDLPENTRVKENRLLYSL